MTGAEAGKLMGRRVLVPAGQSPVYWAGVIEDVREVFGRVDYLVQPVAGEGAAWVSADRCRLEPAGEESGR